MNHKEYLWKCGWIWNDEDLKITFEHWREGINYCGDENHPKPTKEELKIVEKFLDYVFIEGRMRYDDSQDIESW